MLCSVERTEECEQWVTAVKTGNQQLLGKLYDKYSPALYGVIFRITGNQKLAEETLTRTFIKAWREATKLYERDTSLFMWLINTARQSAFDAVKSTYVSSADGENKKFSENVSAFDLVFYKGLSYAEAAAALKISVEEVIINFRMKIKGLQKKNITI
ncbi:MAG: sigma factor [Parafilimonas sp.]